MKKFFHISVLLCCALFHAAGAGAQGWQWGAASACPHGATEGRLMAVDHNGNTFALAWVMQVVPPTIPLISTYGPFSVTDSSGLGDQVVLASTDSSGHFRWVVASQESKMIPIGVAADPFGYSYVLFSEVTFGTFTFGNVRYTPSGSGSQYCAKVDPLGNVVWIKRMPPTCHPGYICTNKAGNVYIAGTFNGSAMFGATTLSTGAHFNSYAACYDSSLNPLWATGIISDSTETVYGLAVSKNNDVFIGGIYSSPIVIGSDTLTDSMSSVTPYYYIARLYPSGAPAWGVRIIPDTLTSYDILSGISADGQSSVYVAGGYYHTQVIGTTTLPYNGDYIEPFLAKFDSSGGFRWATPILETAMHCANQVCADTCGSVWITGTGAAPSAGYSWHDDAVYLARFDTSGSLTDTVFLPSGGDDANGMAIDYRGAVYACSDIALITMPMIVAGDTLGVQADSSFEVLYVAKYVYGPQGCGTLAAAETQVTKDEVMIYPDPTFGSVSVRCGEEGVLDVYDLCGRQAATYAIKSGTTEVQLPDGLSTGVYLCRFQPRQRNSPPVFVKILYER